MGRALQTWIAPPAPEAPSQPLVSIVIPVVGEAERIERCLLAVLAQDWPRDRLEVVVVDGAPGDGTSAVTQEVLANSDVRTEIVLNPGGGRSANLNVGVATAHGDVVCRVDARSAIPPGYVRSCAGLLADPRIAVVGGAQAAVAPGDDAQAKGIRRGLTNPVAMGLARYRRRTPAGEADTVYLGAFRRRDLLRVGGWCEELEVNEDFDLNSRLRQEVGAVWFDPALEVDYLPRDALPAIARQYWAFGRGKARYLRRRHAYPRPRQLVGMGVAPAAVAVAAALVSGRPIARPFGVGLVLVSLAAADHVGSGGQRASVSVRCWGAATAATVATCWSAGLWWELLTGLADD